MTVDQIKAKADEQQRLHNAAIEIRKILEGIEDLDDGWDLAIELATEDC